MCELAAVVPIAGALSCRNQCEKIIDIPKWIFHGSADEIVSLRYANESVEFLENLGPEFVRLNESDVITDEQMNRKYLFTIFNGAKHNVWDRVYSDKVIYKWLLNQKRD